MLSFRIALCYLISRTRLHAVNYVTAISAVAIAVVAMALVCVLSVYNGYVTMILAGTEQIDADILLRTQEGKTFRLADYPDYRKQLSQLGAKAITLRLESKALLRSGQQQWVVDAVGIDSAFSSVYPLAHTHPEASKLHAPTALGSAILFPLDSALNGGGIVPAEVLFPKRLGFTNPLSPASAFQSLEGQVIGQYPPTSQETDGAIYLPLEALQEVLDYDAEEVSAIAIRLRPEVSTEHFKAEVSKLYGGRLVALDREEQHPDLSYLIRMEKLMTYLIMLFILLLAAFNVASSLAMLLIEKQADTRIFSALGAPPSFTQAVFRRVGLLIALAGTSVGMLMGWGICLLQQHFGLIRSGSGIEAMALPVDVRPLDLLIIFASVTLLSYLISLYPTRFLGRSER